MSHWQGYGSWLRMETRTITQKIAYSTTQVRTSLENVVVPQPYRNEVISIAHTSLTAAHLGVKKTCQYSEISTGLATVVKSVRKEPRKIKARHHSLWWTRYPEAIEIDAPTVPDALCEVFTTLMKSWRTRGQASFQIWWRRWWRLSSEANQKLLPTILNVMLCSSAFTALWRAWWGKPAKQPKNGISISPTLALHSEIQYTVLQDLFHFSSCLEEKFEDLYHSWSSNWQEKSQATEQSLSMWMTWRRNSKQPGNKWTRMRLKQRRPSKTIMTRRRKQGTSKWVIKS